MPAQGERAVEDWGLKTFVIDSKSVKVDVGIKARVSSKTCFLLPKPKQKKAPFQNRKMGDRVHTTAISTRVCMHKLHNGVVRIFPTHEVIEHGPYSLVSVRTWYQLAFASPCSPTPQMAVCLAASMPPSPSGVLLLIKSIVLKPA